MNLMLLSFLMIVSGVILYLMGSRRQRSLDVPLVSEHTKIVVGGCLFIGGLALGLLLLLESLR